MNVKQHDAAYGSAFIDKTVGNIGEVAAFKANTAQVFTLCELR